MTDQFACVREAALRPADLARVLRLNRVTVSMWLNGHTNPHRLLQVRVNKVLDAVKLAVKAGSLPVPHDISRRERAHYVGKALKPFLEPVDADGL